MYLNLLDNLKLLAFLRYIIVFSTYDVLDISRKDRLLKIQQTTSDTISLWNLQSTRCTQEPTVPMPEQLAVRWPSLFQPGARGFES